MFIDHLVVDSSAFIHHGPIRETGKNIYTCPEVIEEIKDKATLDSLRFLSYELKLIQFDKDDLDHCVDFAKKTGDYKQLSLVDLKLIAATYQLEKRHNGLKYINKTPKEIQVKTLNKESHFDKLANKCNKSQGDDDEDDDEGWITPDNINQVYEKIGIDKRDVPLEKPILENRVEVACMTSDFSVQNCLLQMGLRVVSPVDGLMIKNARKIALRCHACFKVFFDPVKNDFCPHCGNIDTLKRVQYIVDMSGEKKVLINFKRPIKVKGTNQQLPRPRGGKYANNPVLAPDQKVRKIKQDKFTVEEKKTVTADHILNDPAYLVRNNPFADRRMR